MITSSSYPSLAAHQMLGTVLDNFLLKNPANVAPEAVSFTEIKKAFTDAQDPDKVSSITKIQRELEETKVVLHKTIDSVSLCCFFLFFCWG